MERETLLCVLVVLAGGLFLQLLAWLPPIDSCGARGKELERRMWLRLWCPIVPALIVAAWLGGWTLTQSDPVRDPLGTWVLVAACAPFAFIFARAAARALWALLLQAPDCGVFTNGLVRPQIVFSPFLAKQLDDVVIRAALAHEQAHARHRDPLRIWLAQLATDLQWPWPAAQRRLETWLLALELARDEEARGSGTDGNDLAAAVLASMRFSRATQGLPPVNGTAFAHARLIGDSGALRERVARLLASPAPLPLDSMRSSRAAVFALLSVLLTALTLGVIFGDRVMPPLLALTS